MRDHRSNIERDALILLTNERDYACAMSRGAYFPLPDAEFGASGCLDAPMWLPAGGCSQWHHNAGHVGMTVFCREWT